MSDKRQDIFPATSSDAEMLEWAQRRVLFVLEKHAEACERGNAFFALGILVGMAWRSEERKPVNGPHAP